MGIVDDIAGKAGSVLGGLGGKDTKLIASVIRIVQERFGGIDGLIEAFKAQGLGGIISSWVSGEKNEPISKEQVEKGFGEDNVRDAAKDSGMTEDEAAGRLTDLLPKVVDKLTPDNQGGGSLLERGKSVFGL